MKDLRLARGKENFEKKKFMDNPETLEYISTLPKETPKVETPAEKKAREAKEAEDAKSKQ